MAYTYPRPVARCTAALVLHLAVLALLSIFAGDLLIALYELGVLAGWVERGQPPVLTIWNVDYRVVPQWFSLAAGLALYLIVFSISFAAALGLYHRLTARARRSDGEINCGVCGFILRGLVDARCSECGTPIGGGRRRRPSMIRAAAVATIVYAVAFAASLMANNLVALVAPQFLTGLARIIGSILVGGGLLLALWAYGHRAFPRLRDGNTYCGHCDRPLPPVSEPICPNCQHGI